MSATTDAERALIGCLLIDPEATAEVAALVSPDDFLDARSRLVYEAILTCEAVDFVLVSCELERRGTLDKVGTAFLTSLCLYTPTSLHAPRYARFVAQAAADRRAKAAPAELPGLTGVEIR